MSLKEITVGYRSSYRSQRSSVQYWSSQVTKSRLTWFLSGIMWHLSGSIVCLSFLVEDFVGSLILFEWPAELCGGWWWWWWWCWCRWCCVSSSVTVLRLSRLSEIAESARVLPWTRHTRAKKKKKSSRAVDAPQLRAPRGAGRVTFGWMKRFDSVAGVWSRVSKNRFKLSKRIEPICKTRQAEQTNKRWVELSWESNLGWCQFWGTLIRVLNN